MNKEQAEAVVVTAIGVDAALRGETPNMNRASWLVSEGQEGRIWMDDELTLQTKDSIMIAAFAAVKYEDTAKLVERAIAN